MLLSQRVGNHWRLLVNLEQMILVPICSWNHEMIWSWVVQHKHKCRICWPQDPSPPCTSPHSGSVHSLWGSIPENSISFAGTVDFFLGLKKMLCLKKILIRKKNCMSQKDVGKHHLCDRCPEDFTHLPLCYYIFAPMKLHFSPMFWYIRPFHHESNFLFESFISYFLYDP